MRTAAAAVKTQLEQAVVELDDLEAEAFASWRSYRERIDLARKRVVELQLQDLERPPPSFIDSGRETRLR